MLEERQAEAQRRWVARRGPAALREPPPPTRHARAAEAARRRRSGAEAAAARVGAVKRAKAEKEAARRRACEAASARSGRTAFGLSAAETVEQWSPAQLLSSPATPAGVRRQLARMAAEERAAPERAAVAPKVASARRLGALSAQQSEKMERRA